MTISQGQRVRIRGKCSEGTIEKKLMSLDNVYIVKIDSTSPHEDKLVRGDDLELLADVARDAAERLAYSNDIGV